MKRKWLFVPLIIAALFSCEKQETEVPSATPTATRNIPAPTKIEPVPDTPNSSPGARSATAETPGNQSTNSENASSRPSQPSPRKVVGVPVAKAVEGQPGFVFSPYSDKVVDVRGMPPGTLVADPTSPATEKKHFRLPP